MIVTTETLHERAAGFGLAVSRGWMTYAECYDLLCATAARHLPEITGAAFDRFCIRLGATLARAADEPELVASQAVRDTVRPMLAKRAARGAVMLAAYRAAGDDLPMRAVDHVVREEVAAFMQERRHAA